MKHVRLRTLAAFLLTVCFYFPGLAYANNQISGGISTTPTSAVTAEIAGCDLKYLKYNPSALFDSGVPGSIALHSSGLVLEFHNSPYDKAMWYRVGKQSPLNKNHVVWGNSQSVGRAGSWPAVALSKEGYVIAVYSDSIFKSGSQQYYRVGKIDPNGDEKQSIHWITEFIHWEGGFHTSLAMNDNGVIVGVHETNDSASTGLYYRVGQLRNPAGGDYTIAWSSGSRGVKYDDGISPHIALNNHNQVVEVHQVTWESLLHYRRGTVSAGQITFAASQRYDNDADEPAVALLDSGLVLEVHASWKRGGLYSRTGMLDPSDSTLIQWQPAVDNGAEYDASYPALATNGRYAFQTHGKSDPLPFGTGPKIYYSGAEIQCPNL
jgi:hypothetical protein